MLTATASSIRHRLALVLPAIIAGLLVATGVGAATEAADAAARISAGGVHVPTISNFCGGTSVIVEVTFCNSEPEEQTYTIQDFIDGGIPPVYSCTESFIPDYTILDANPVTLDPGECQSVRVEIFRPDLLDVHSNLCYWIRIGTTSSGVVVLGMQLIDSILGCVDWAFEESAIFVHPLDPVALDPIISNEWFELISSDWYFEVRRPDGIRDASVVSLNDMPPGKPVPAMVELEPGQSMMVPLTAEWVSPGVEGIYEIVLVGEIPMAGEPAPRGGIPLVPSDVASIGIGEVLALVATGEPGATPPGDARLRLTPNPMGADGVSITLSAPAEIVVVLDASGRMVRELSPAGASTLAWDGRDQSGRRVEAGVYFVNARTTAGQTTRRLVILP